MQSSLFTIQIIIMMILFSYFLIHFILIIKHKKYVMAHKNEVPKDFTQHISLKEHQKSANYVYANSDLNQSSLVFEVMLFLMFTYGGGINILQSFVNEFIQVSIWQDTLLVLLFITVVQILQIPFSIFKTFFIEQRFGFNKQTAKDFVFDLLKSYLLSIFIIGLLLVGIFYLIEKISHWWIWGAIFVISFNLLMSFLYPSFIAPIFNKFKPIEESEFANAINDLLQKCHFKNKGVFVMDGSKRSTHMNAYFTGFGKNKRIVLFDTLMDKLSAQELKSVLAHELGHYHHRHIQKRIGFLVVQILAAFYLLYWIKDNQVFYHAFGVNYESSGALIVLISLILPVVLFFVQPLSSYFSRKHEFEADRYAAQQTSSTDLVSALLKLYRHNSATLTPHPWYSKCFDSHPPAKERIDHLNNVNSK